MTRPADPYQSVAWQSFFTGWGAELEAQLDRVGHLIGDVHRQSEGSFREILLRDLLRRVLPPRYRVSTGFVVGWGERASTQMDVLIWDAEKHTALMEVGEFAVVQDEAVKGLIEVKTTLNPAQLASSLKALHPEQYSYWSNNAAPKSALPAPRWSVVPPVRAVLAYRSVWNDSAPQAVLSRLARFYRRRFQGDLANWLLATRALFRCTNLIDVVGVGNAFVVEQGTLYALAGGETVGSSYGFCAREFSGTTRQAWLARFCLAVANRIISAHQGHWNPNDAGLDRLPATFASFAAVPVIPLTAATYRWNFSETDLLNGPRVLK